MMRYTIFLTDPTPEAQKDCTQNCAGQWIVFDGSATRSIAESIARVFQPQAAKVEIFRGRNIGRLFKTYEKSK